MHASKNDNRLDQFYTQPEVAEKCWRAFLRVAEIDLSDYWFIEPAAGCGSFYQLLPSQRRIGLDIAPQKLPRITGEGIMQTDYLKWRPKRAQKYIVIGNPPFGKRGKTAVKFFNHSAYADFIAFVVPVSFRKFFMHRRLHDRYALIARETLHKKSFQTPDGKDYSVNAEFQIWTRLPTPLPNLREKKPAPIAHQDFRMRQYNNTKQALPMFDAPFDFAVPCQGYQDYTRRETNPASCEKHKQWILFTARNKKIRNRLMKIDYTTLAQESATATPGFRKNDVVKHYSFIAE